MGPWDVYDVVDFAQASYQKLAQKHEANKQKRFVKKEGKAAKKEEEKRLKEEKAAQEAEKRLSELDVDPETGEILADSTEKRKRRKFSQKS